MKHCAFHLSLPCYSVTKTKNFYIDTLGAKMGRHSTQWVDIDLFGNQITFTKSGEFLFSYKSYKFGDTVLPAFHFGIILDEKNWDIILNKISEKREEPIVTTTFLKDKKGEHTSFFIEDPNGYLVEFKKFEGTQQVFAS